MQSTNALERVAGRCRQEPLLRSHRQGGQEDADHDAGNQIRGRDEIVIAAVRSQKRDHLRLVKHRHHEQARNGGLDGDDERIESRPAGRPGADGDDDGRQQDGGRQGNHRAHLLEWLGIDCHAPGREHVMGRRRVEIRERRGEPGERGGKGQRHGRHRPARRDLRRGWQRRQRSRAAVPRRSGPTSALLCAPLQGSLLRFRHRPPGSSRPGRLPARRDVRREMRGGQAVEEEIHRHDSLDAPGVVLEHAAVADVQQELARPSRVSASRMFQ